MPETLEMTSRSTTVAELYPNTGSSFLGIDSASVHSKIYFGGHSDLSLPYKIRGVLEWNADPSTTEVCFLLRQWLESLLTEEENSNQIYRTSSYGVWWYSQKSRELAESQFLEQLNLLFESESLEDGMTHPAENVVLQAILRNPHAQDEIASLARNQKYNYRAELLRVTGRLPSNLVSQWGTALMKEMLLSVDIEIRDAAVRALELWALPESIEILDSHRDPTPWLNDYIQRVVADLKRYSDVPA